MNNYEKRDKYAILMSKLKKSTSNAYYYEAIFIIYDLFEDRTESILKHAKIKTKNNKEQNFKLMEKIRKIRDRNEFQDKYIKKHISNELLDEIIEWKRSRDTLIHDLVNSEYENEEIKNLALKGECLIMKFNGKFNLVNKYLDKNNGNVVKNSDLKSVVDY